MAGEIKPAQDVLHALITEKLMGYFTSLAPSHQREYLKWIDEAKKPQTRLARITKMCEMLHAKQE